MRDFRESPGRGLAPRQQFFDATVPIGTAGDNPTFFGSGFLVANVQSRSPYVDVDASADVFLVTASHVVAQPLFAGEVLCMRVPRYNQEAAVVDLPPFGNWVRSDTGADVMVVRMPNLRHEYRDGGWGFPVIAADQFFVDPWCGSQFNLGDTVRAVGLWYGTAGRTQMIMRSGTMAIAPLDLFRFPGGETRVYLADCTVTRGMSGGPVYMTHGEGWAENALIGLTHGFWPLPIEELQHGPRGDETNEDRARRWLLSQVEHLNTQLTVVVPVHEIAETLIRANWLTRVRI